MLFFSRAACTVVGFPKKRMAMLLVMVLVVWYGWR